MLNKHLATMALAVGSGLRLPARQTAPLSASATVQSSGAGDITAFDGVVEAVRQTVVAAQVPGAIVALDVKVGDVVKAGQVLARIDARAAEQTLAASDAQVQAARAMLEAATTEFERQKKLSDMKYIEPGRSRARRSAVQDHAGAGRGADRPGGGGAHPVVFYTIKAPYGGVVSEVPVALGDMAMPGRALLTVYDPAALRVIAAVPQTALARMAAGRPIRIQFPGFSAERQWVTPVRVKLLPTADPARTPRRSASTCPPMPNACRPERLRGCGCRGRTAAAPASTCRRRPSSAAPR